MTPLPIHLSASFAFGEAVVSSPYVVWNSLNHVLGLRGVKKPVACCATTEELVRIRFQAEKTNNAPDLYLGIVCLHQGTRRWQGFGNRAYRSQEYEATSPAFQAFDQQQTSWYKRTSLSRGSSGIEIGHLSTRNFQIVGPIRNRNICPEPFHHD